MADSSELPDKIERLQINLEDDVRSFLLSRTPGRRLSEEARAECAKDGVDVRHLLKPTYISIMSGCDLPEEGREVEDSGVGAEGCMIHEDEPIVHLAYKCGDPEEEMHYTRFMPLSIVEMAKAMERVWPGSVMSALVHQAAQEGRATILSQELDEESVERLMRAVEQVDEEGPGFDLEPDFEPETDETDETNES